MNPAVESVTPAASGADTAPEAALPRARVRAVTGAAALVLGLLAVLVVVSLGIGSNPLGPLEVLRGLIAHDETREAIIVWELRMPRTALAVLVGAALGVAGVLMQALTRNPLAEPGLLGVNAGAALAVVLSISLLQLASTASTLAFAAAGSALASSAVFLVARRRPGVEDRTRIVLAGAAISASLGSITGIITLYDSSTFSSYRFWVIGSVADRGLEPVLAIAPVVALGLLLAACLSPALNVLALGDEQAVALGVPLGWVRVLTLAAITALCAAATAAAGPIAFVGLVVPHALRLLVGVDQRALMLLAVVAGPALVLAADIIGRVAVADGELEVGLVTTAIGAPVLLALVMRRRAA